MKISSVRRVWFVDIVPEVGNVHFKTVLWMGSVVTWVPSITALDVSTNIDGSSKYTEWPITDNRQGLVLQIMGSIMKKTIMLRRTQ
jgi:hypothetical protein